jgi:hypothetical protein
LFACVDARGKFTYVNAGQPGSVGDAFTYNCSDLKRKIESKSWLNVPDEFLPHMRLDDATFQPFLCADSAFALSPSLMKCFEVDHPTHEQFNFNYALIRMRRVVECAFGRLKKRFPIFKNSRLSDPIFAQKVLGVLCALHNYIEGFAENVARANPASMEIRDKLAAYMARTLDLAPVGRLLPSHDALLNGPVGYDDIYGYNGYNWG